MRTRATKTASLLLLGLVACGFESRVQGRWKLDPSTFSGKDLRKAGVPPELAKGFEDGVFVVEDGVVYLGAVHRDTAMVEYAIGTVRDDCADVKITASDGAGQRQSRSIDACLHGDRLVVEYDGGKAPIEITLQRTE